MKVKDPVISMMVANIFADGRVKDQFSSSATVGEVDEDETLLLDSNSHKTGGDDSL